MDTKEELEKLIADYPQIVKPLLDFSLALAEQAGTLLEEHHG